MTTAIRKEAYYRDRAMSPHLAAHYFHELRGARRILDVGCGTGEFGRFKPAPDIQVYGVDHDAGAVERARQYEEAVPLDLESERLPWREETFDGVLARDVLEHLQRPAELAADLYRVLRPGGVMVASVVMAKPSAVWADYTHVRGFTRSAAALLFEDVGFTVERVWRMGPVPLSNRLRIPRLVPHLLRLPIFAQLWAASWELRLRK